MVRAHAVGAREHRSALGEPIEARRADVLVSQAREGVCALIVAEQEENVGTLACRSGNTGQAERKCESANEVVHG